MKVNGNYIGYAYCINEWGKNIVYVKSKRYNNIITFLFFKKINKQMITTKINNQTLIKKKNIDRNKR